MYGVSSFPVGKALDLLFIIVRLDLGGSSQGPSQGSFPTLRPPVPSIPPAKEDRASASPVCILTASISCSISVSHRLQTPCREQSCSLCATRGQCRTTHGRGSETIIEQICDFQKLRSLTLTDSWQAPSNFSPSSPFRFFIHRSLYFLSGQNMCFWLASLTTGRLVFMSDVSLGQSGKVYQIKFRLAL